MIEQIEGIPAHVAGFTASGEVTNEDYKYTVIPRIEEVLKGHGHIHFLLVLDTDVSNFTGGAWMSDAFIGLKHLAKWKKMAIVSDQKGVEKITDMVSPILPGKSRGFSHNQLEQAKDWVSSED